MRHLLRPDRVYRTSVLSPIPGYQPASNAYAVMQCFTSAPAFATYVPRPQAGALPPQIPATSGAVGYISSLGNPYAISLFRGNGTWWEQIKLRFAAFRAKLSQAKVNGMLTRLQSLVAARSQPTPASYVSIPNEAARLTAGQYGPGIGADGMASVATSIVANAVSTGGTEATLPSVAIPMNQNAQQLVPGAAGIPSQLAAQAGQMMPPYVARESYNAVMNRFYGQRRMWWG